MIQYRDEIHLAFVIQNFTVSPEELTKSIGIEPTEAYAKGESKKAGKHLIPIRANSWQIKSQLSTDLIKRVAAFNAEIDIDMYFLGSK